MKRILCFGDSNTWGFAPKDGYRFDENTRWTGLVQKALPQYKIIEEGLNGRTALWDDPIEGYKNGKEYLIPCLASQSPLDLVILMLGTNDCKTRFALTASDVAAGVRELANLILSSGCGPEGRAPRLLVMCPAPLRYTREPDYCASFDDNSNRISRELPAKFARFTREIGWRLSRSGPHRRGQRKGRHPSGPGSAPKGGRGRCCQDPRNSRLTEKKGAGRAPFFVY